MLLFDFTRILLVPDWTPRDKFYEKVEKSLQDEGCPCWFPVWGDREAFKNSEKLMIGARSISITNWDKTYREFTIGEGETGKVRVATFFYPYWKAKVNGNPLVPEKDEFGVIWLPINKEVSNVQLYFEEPLFLNVAFWTSFLTWIILLGITIYYSPRVRWIYHHKITKARA